MLQLRVAQEGMAKSSATVFQLKRSGMDKQVCMYQVLKESDLLLEKLCSATVVATLLAE